MHSLTKSGIEDEGVAIIASGILKHPECALRRFWYVTHIIFVMVMND